VMETFPQFDVGTQEEVVFGPPIPFRAPVVVELMGHVLMAGYGQEVEFAGQSQLQVTIPEMDSWPDDLRGPFYIPGQSMYRTSIVSESLMLEVAARMELPDWYERIARERMEDYYDGESGVLDREEEEPGDDDRTQAVDRDQMEMGKEL